MSRRKPILLRLLDISILAGAALFSIACVSYPDSSTYYDSAIRTAYDKDTSFSDFKTFGLKPTIQLLDTDSNTSTDLDATATTAILQAITANMIARGYTQVGPEENPDIGVEVTVLKTLRTYQAAVPFYWWDYYGYPTYWGTNYYYPSYWITTSAYNVGTMVVQYFDTRAHDPNADVSMIWNAVVYKILTGGTATNTQEAVAGINQAFVQSPYLKR